MNWVEKRARTEAMLDNGAPAIWDQVRSAIQDACASFTQYYEANFPQSSLTCELENGKRVKVSRVIDHGRLQRIVAFDEQEPSIKVSSDKSTSTYKIEADEQAAYVTHQGSRIDADELSKLVLEPLLFPTKQRSHPSSYGKHWMS
jgi:hypothetical protein